MVGLLPLEESILVRIQVWQIIDEGNFLREACVQCTHAPWIRKAGAGYPSCKTGREARLESALERRRQCDSRGIQSYSFAAALGILTRRRESIYTIILSYAKSVIRYVFTMDDTKALEILIGMMVKYPLTDEEEEAVREAIGILGWTKLMEGRKEGMKKARDMRVR